MNEKKRPVLSISMLVSNNRRDTIEKCMESLVPLREAVPSELIIVDTGCTDGSVDIARKYADKVIEFTWCNDFSAARNAGLRECTGEWFLYLDDDEWFEDVTELITFFRGEERKRMDTLWYLQRNYDNFEGTSYVDTYVGRVARLTPETRFCGKIHEWLEPLPERVKKTNAYIHHYGYVYKSEEDRQKHLKRNLTLEEEAVKENPADIRMCCQLVQEYRAARRFEDAEALCKTTLSNTKYEITNSFVQYLLLVLPKIYVEQKNYEKALEEFEHLERKCKLLHQTKLGLCYEKAMTYGYMKKEEDTVKGFLRYLTEYYVLPKAGDPVEHPVMDFAQYQSELFFHKAVEYAVANMICGEVYGYGEEVYARMNWEKTEKPKEMLAGLIRCYEETGNAALLTKHLPIVLQMNELEQHVYASLHSLYVKLEGEKQDKLLADLEPLNLRTGNLAFFHLLYTERKGITTDSDVNDYYEKSDRKYDAEVVALFFGNAERFPKLLDSTPLELFVEAVSVLLAGKNRPEIEKLWQELSGLEVCYPEEKKSFFYYASMVIAEKRPVLATEQRSVAEQGGDTEQRGAAEQGINAEQEKTGDDAATGAEVQCSIASLLRDYIAAAKRYAESLYRPELLNAAGVTALPANLRFVYIMEQAMEYEEDFTRWGDAVKRAAKEYPAMLPVVKALLTERKQRSSEGEQTVRTHANTANSAKQELLALAEQLKAMVRAQLAEGKTEEAKAILSELAVMLPEDEEVKELLGE